MEDSNQTQTTWEELDRRSIEMHTKPYYDWIKHVVTISLGTLTALVSLKGQYIPANPVIPWALAGTLLFLVGCILCGLVALQEEYLAPLRAAKQRRMLRQEVGDTVAAQRLRRSPGVAPSRIHTRTRKAMQLCLASALILLCAFAIANIPLV